MQENGLTQAQANELFKKFGPNEIAEKKEHIALKIVKIIFSPVVIMLVVAAFLALYVGKDFDAYFILGLTLLNVFITLWHEHKADTALAALKAKLAVRSLVLRGGKWERIESKFLVPGDVVQLAVGEVVPADGKIFEDEHISINEAALTGESLPQDKNVGDEVYSGSYVTTGKSKITITATGTKTYFGKTLTLVEKAEKRSTLEEDIMQVSRFLMVVSSISIIILSAVLLSEHLPYDEVLRLDISLLIAGIPVALPTVMSLIISIGMLELARKGTIIRRLAALEDLANVDLLLTDKTGTLTQNKISIEKVLPYNGFSEEDIMRFAVLTVEDNDDNPIGRAVRQKAERLGATKDAEVVTFIPADSERKRATAIARRDGKEFVVSVGATQITADLSPDDKERDRFSRDVEQAATEGYRAIGVAYKEGDGDESNMRLIGALLLSDPLWDDAKDVIVFLQAHGVGVKMLTGDHHAIAKRIAGELGLKGEAVARNAVDWEHLDRAELTKIAAFAEILPKDKYDLVRAAKRQHIVAVTGDGVNDLPALRTAEVGVAVANAVDALKGAADIVLTGEGISIIKDAFIEARKIFTRLYSYSVYRISESFRLVITVLVLGILYTTYPLDPLQIILLAFLNDIPIISLAFNRVRDTSKPGHINAKKRFILSSLYGLTGIAESLILFIGLMQFTNLGLHTIQTAFFLKLTVSGHMLIYVAHTKERWYKYLPSMSVILATTLTQLLATAVAIVGFLMYAIPWWLAVGVWLWAFLWMQVAELMKDMTEWVSQKRTA